MNHQWKIGDWFELGEKRYLVYRVEQSCYFGISFGGGVALRKLDDPEPKHLPDCTGWDWHPTPREWWVNEYQERNGSMSTVMHHGVMHHSRKLADECAGSHRVRCIRVREVIE
jgi:hypothetical protein